jgi:hypothetical protein
MTPFVLGYVMIALITAGGLLWDDYSRVDLIEGSFAVAAGLFWPLWLPIVAVGAAVAWVVRRLHP